MLKPAMVSAILNTANIVNCVVIDRLDKILRIFGLACYISKDEAGQFSTRLHMILPLKALHESLSCAQFGC
jgi:hypothetical protein